MPAVVGLETNEYQDFQLIAGTTFSQQFNVLPLDATGGSATLRIKGVNTDGSDLDVDITLTITDEGVNKQTNFSWTVDAATTTDWSEGAYPYQIFLTFLAGDVLAYGTGMILVK